MLPAWNLKANRCPAHCLVRKSFWSGHYHCCYGSSPGGLQLSSAAIQLATTHSRLRTRSHTGQKKSTRPLTMKNLASISPNSLKTIRVFKDEVYSYQILSFDLALCNEKSLIQVLQVFLMWHGDKAIENDHSRSNHQLMLLSMWTKYSK